MTWRRFFLYIVPIVAHMGLIAFLSSRSDLPVGPPPFPGSDKVVHACLFGFLTFLMVRGWVAGQWQQINWTIVIGAIVATSLYGVTDEIHQMFVPNRHPDVLDWVADTVGALIVGTGLFFFAQKENGRQPE